jgi:hypothetical protein
MGKFSKVNVKIPDTPDVYRYGSKSYSDPSVKADNMRMLRNINTMYGSSVNFWGSVFETGNNLLLAFIATESGGRMAPPNRFNATGLMQVTPPALYDCYKKWGNEVDADMPSEVNAELNRKLPELIKAKSLSTALTTRILSVLQRDAAFNIMAGSLVLRWMLERFSTIWGGGQLNKAMVAYNAGAYTRSLVTSGSKADTNPVDTSVLIKNTRVPLESRNYLLKMLGKDGFLALLLIDKALTASANPSTSPSKKK